MDIAGYLLQANVCLAVFYLFYWLLLRNETYFLLNRIYLLAGAALAFIIPLLKTEWMVQNTISKVVQLEIGNVLVTGSQLNKSVQFDWQLLLTVIYGLGFLVSLILLLYKLLVIKKMLKRPIKGMAFSFFKTKIIDPNLAGFELIDKHEQAHMAQWHTLDVLFLEIISVFNWFNPVVYLYKSNVKNIHEYLADESVIKQQGNKKKYAIFLLSRALDAVPQLANPFLSQSQLKLRIRMIQKQRTAKSKHYKYVLCIPLLAILVLLVSASTGASKMLQADRTATFPGGFDQFESYLIQAGKQAKDVRRGNSVTVGFMVDTDGEVKEATIVKGVNKEMDREALRMINESPRWKPAIQNGQLVKVKYQIKLNF